MQPSFEHPLEDTRSTGYRSFQLRLQAQSIYLHRERLTRHTEEVDSQRPSNTFPPAFHQRPTPRTPLRSRLVCPDFLHLPIAEGPQLAQDALF